MTVARSMQCEVTADMAVEAGVCAGASLQLDDIVGVTELAPRLLHACRLLALAA
jgi:hypothetical protein